MITSTRILALGGTLTLALSAAAGATTVRLAPLAGTTVAPSIACAASAAPAAITELQAPVLPSIAEGQHVTGVTKLRIVLDGGGHLTRDEVLTSSGNRWLDDAARVTARLSRYRSETRDCESVGGAYAMIVDFNPAPLP